MKGFFMNSLIKSILFSCLSLAIYSTEQPANQPSFNIYVQGGNAQAQASSISSASVALELWNIIGEKCTDTINAAQQTVATNAGSLKDFITSHKMSLAAGSTGFLYSYLWAKIMHAHARIHGINSWSSWCQDIPLQAFLSLSQDIAEQKLLEEIQRRYIDFDHPTNFISPMVMFSSKLQQEIAAVEFLKTTYTWINRLYASKLFMITEKTTADLEHKANRLYFIKHVFTTWSINYNLQSARKNNA